ncbi:DUF390 domain-containing protein [Altericroceibacterium xinjiangense]|uniref:F0F1 ATP synthase subunit B family protein n=1 Tax=Altericroceibacterium xinjiangense TaxID=762261 RepID=UPI000F7DCDC9|nr:DUF390 domain-containing protein [Altericroceibacterium xinjiangense]
MPQLSQLAETYASQIFWLLAIFGLVFFVIGRGMVPKVMDTVTTRDQQIQQDLTAAEAARTKADEEEEAWRKRENDNRAQSQALINQARVAAAEQVAARLEVAQAGFDEKIADAEAQIAAARLAATAEIEAVASDAAQDIVERVAGMHIAPQTASAAVKEVMIHG